jgi:hypothetical protein
MFLSTTAAYQRGRIRRLPGVKVSIRFSINAVCKNPLWAIQYTAAQNKRCHNEEIFAT